MNVLEDADHDIIGSHHLQLTLTGQISDSNHQRPPSGLSSVSLESIHLDFSFSTHRSKIAFQDTPRQEIVPFEVPGQARPHHHPVDDASPLQRREGPTQRQDVILYELPADVKNTRLSQASREAFSLMLRAEGLQLSIIDKKLSALALQTDVRHFESGESDELLTHAVTLNGASTNDGPPLNGIVSVESLTSDAVKLPLRGKVRDYFRSGLDFPSVNCLLDASLRFVFCDRRSSRSEGIYLTRISGFPPLSTVAPTLFSPGLAQVRFSLQKRPSES